MYIHTCVFMTFKWEKTSSFVELESSEVHVCPILLNNSPSDSQ